MSTFSQFQPRTILELNLKGNIRGDVQISTVFGRAVKQQWFPAPKRQNTFELPVNLHIWWSLLPVISALFADRTASPSLHSCMFNTDVGPAGAFGSFPLNLRDFTSTPCWSLLLCVTDVKDFNMTFCLNVFFTIALAPPYLKHIKD